LGEWQIARASHLKEFTLKGFTVNLSQLANAALLGTQRYNFPSFSKTPLAAVAEKLENAGAESKLLSLAGTLSLYEQAGMSPLKLKRVVNDLPSHDVPRCSPEAAKYLTKMLEGQHAEFLPEFLTTLAKANQRVPEEALPILLDRARNVYNLRTPLMAALGETGQWLARQNPVWHFAAFLNFENASVDWKSNVMLARQGILKQARAKDARLGLELINSTWKNESPTDRIWLIKALQINLSLDDEPFLETALDDRSFTVRKIAAELLSTLPDSRLSKRMITRAETIFELRDAELFVDFPEVTPQLIRDGVGRPLWNDTEKVLASQLSDIVSLLPLSFWFRKFDAMPESLIEAARASIWSKSFLSGFTNAIERQHNHEWALALLTTEGYNAQTMKVLSVLTLGEMDIFVRFLHEKTGDKSLSGDNVLLKILSRWLQPWSVTMCEIFMLHLQRHLEQPEVKPPDMTLESTLKIFARFCPRNFISHALVQLTVFSNHDGLKKSCIEPLLISGFRQKMLKEIGALENGRN
jgi:hypothetical protein